ncbi:MAG: hypothetical protein Q4E99_04800, partial [Bacillota bacterium]|nr:hypothetical protein [Bacillota bacterium]
EALDDSFIDDYIVEIDGDGVNDLICNCIFGGDGHKEAYIFKNNKGNIKRGYFDRKQLKDLPEDLIDLVSSVITEFDSSKKQLRVDYISLKKDSEYTTLYKDLNECMIIWEDWSIDEETLMNFNSHGTSLLGSAHTVKYIPFKDVLGFSGYILDDYYPIEGYITRSYCAIEHGKAYYFADARIFEEYLSDSLVDIDNDGELELITNNIRVASSLAEAVIYKRFGDTVKYGMVKDAACSYFDNSTNQFEIHLDSNEDKTIYLDLNKAEITWLGEMER